jgi:hypothetical protein
LVYEFHPEDESWKALRKNLVEVLRMAQALEP